MNIILKSSFIAALILTLGGNTVKTHPQRCGGDLSYFLRNQKGEIIDTEKISLRYLRKIPVLAEPVTYAGDHIHEDVEDLIMRQRLDENLLEPDSGGARAGTIKVLWLRSGCGQHLIEVELKYENQVMTLRFHNIPAETNFLVDSAPFRKGTYEIDFKSDASLKSLKLNREGIRNKEGEYLFRSEARLGYLVSVENWTKGGSQNKGTSKNGMYPTADTTALMFR